MQDDYYADLGVLPDAEDVVIKAAYRALAQRYHPDKWRGDPAQAHARMLRINRAYEVLCDASSRTAYDKARDKSAQGRFDTGEEESRAFDDAISEMLERWNLACSIYSDLEVNRSRLSRISTSLSFTYMTQILTQRAFQNRGAMAQQLEEAFLQRYFGTNPKILQFAKDLIDEGAKDAARRLNQIIDVMGSEIEVDLIIDRVERDLPAIRSAHVKNEKARKLKGLSPLVNLVLERGNYPDATELARSMGYKISERSGGIFSDTKVDMIKPDGEKIEFENKWMFIAWVKDRICLTKSDA